MKHISYFKVSIFFFVSHSMNASIFYMAMYASIVFTMIDVAPSPYPFLSLVHSSPSPLPFFPCLIPLILTPIYLVLVPFYTFAPFSFIYFPHSIISCPFFLTPPSTHSFSVLSSTFPSFPPLLSHLFSHFSTSPLFPLSSCLTFPLLLYPFFQSWAWSSNFPIGPLTRWVAWLTTREAHRKDGVKHSFYTNRC